MEGPPWKGLTTNPTNRPNQKSFLAEEILHSTYSVSNYGNGTITFEAGNVALWTFFWVPQNFCLEFINHQPYFRCFVFWLSCSQEAVVQSWARRVRMKCGAAYQPFLRGGRKINLSWDLMGQLVASMLLKILFITAHHAESNSTHKECSRSNIKTLWSRGFQKAIRYI